MVEKTSKPLDRIPADAQKLIWCNLTLEDNIKLVQMNRS